MNYKLYLPVKGNELPDYGVCVNEFAVAEVTCLDISAD